MVIQEFIDCIKYDRAPDITAQDGRVAVEMVLGAYQSAKLGKRIQFPLQ